MSVASGLVIATTVPVSTVRFCTVVAVFPSTSVAVTDTGYVPSSRSTGTTTDQVPSGATVAVSV